MNDTYEIDVVRRVVDNDNGHGITVGPSGDFPGNVMLYTEPLHEEYFGKLRLDLPAPFMRKIGQALIAAADEADQKE
jgi:hypothetical protein